MVRADPACHASTRSRAAVRRAQLGFMFVALKPLAERPSADQVWRACGRRCRMCRGKPVSRAGAGVASAGAKSSGNLPVQAAKRTISMRCALDTRLQTALQSVPQLPT